MEARTTRGRAPADHRRCSRQRVYDLLSQGWLTRLEDGSRVLVARVEVDAYLRGEPTGPLARHERTTRDVTKSTRDRHGPSPEAPRLFSSDPF
jgi:hypothetical protein